MTLAVTKQHPSNALVFQKIVTSWCMAPIKRKNRDVVEAFRQGKLAKPLIHENVVAFLSSHSQGMLNITQEFNVRLVKSRYDGISAVSPDAIAVLQIATEVPTEVAGDSKIAKDCENLVSYLGKLSDADETVELSFEDNTLYYKTVVVMEYKYKSEAGTIQESRNIIGNVLNGGRIKVICLGTAAGDAIFRRAIPNVDYRCQLLHEAYVCCVNIVLYAVALTSIDFVIVIMVDHSIREMYCSLTSFMKKKHLNWLFKHGNDSDQFDDTLERMPQYSSSEVTYGYARDSDTVRCRLQIMMCLWQLRCESGQPLLPADALIPRFVSSWNISKGPIDDMSHVLSTCLPSFGAIPGICWIWVRVFSTSLYNGWRLHVMNQSRSTVLSDDCDNRKKISNA